MISNDDDIKIVLIMLTVLIMNDNSQSCPGALIKLKCPGASLLNGEEVRLHWVAARLKVP